MNRDFEMAKVLATIAGFLVIAASIYFSSAQSYSICELDTSSSGYLNYTGVTEYCNITHELWKINSGMGFSFLLTGIIFGGVSLLFATKGYIHNH